MKLSPLLIICLFAFLCQIAFSIYYSIVIVDQNALLNKQQKQIADLNVIQQELKNSQAAHTSLMRVYEASDSSSLSPIKQSIDLR